MKILLFFLFLHSQSPDKAPIKIYTFLPDMYENKGRKSTNYTDELLNSNHLSTSYQVLKKTPIHFTDSLIKLIDCQKAITSSDKVFIGRHIAALKTLDASIILSGQPESSLQSILAKAIVKKDVMDGQILYKFPLYKELGDFQLVDEPRSNYDFYAVFVDKDTHLIHSTFFFYYKKVKYRPLYDEPENKHSDSIKSLLDQLQSTESRVVNNAIGSLSYFPPSRATIKSLHSLLRKNIRNKVGNQRRQYWIEADNGNEFTVEVSQNQLLITALAKLEALEAVPTLMSLLGKTEKQIGITHENLLYLIHTLTSEPVEYTQNGELKTYPLQVPFKEYLIKTRK